MSILTACLLAPLLAMHPASARADELPQPCRIYVEGNWQDLGQGAATSCLKAVDRWVSDYNAQGFKFGAWSRLMLASDRDAFYQSEDEGRTWKLIGRKDDLRKATDLAGELSGPLANAAGSAAPEPSAPARDEHRACSLLGGENWRSARELTLEECASALEQRVSSDAGKDYRYGYWSGVFLAAGPTGLLRSDNGTDWTLIRARTPDHN